MAEGKKHCDECFHLAPRRQIHYGNRERSGPFQLDGNLIARFDNPLHRVSLRPQELLPFLIGRAEIARAADATLWCNPIRKFLEDHIETKESGHILERPSDSTA